MIDQRELRDALGCFATGVTILTTGENTSSACAMTINAFSAVSLDPPLVLVCIKNDSYTLGVAEDMGKFAVHIVASDQKEVALACAKNGQQEGPAISLSMSDNNIPTLDHFLARFECELESNIQAGDHRILMGRVIDFTTAEKHVMPLTFFRGQLGEFQLDAA